LIRHDKGKIPHAAVVLGRSNMLPVVETLLQQMHKLSDQLEDWMLGTGGEDHKEIVSVC